MPTIMDLGKIWRKIRPHKKESLVNIKNIFASANTLAHVTSLVDPEEIPRQVFQTWKTSWIDEKHASSLAKYINSNSEFKFYFFDDDDMNNYMKKRWGKHLIYEIYENILVGAARADIWRYCILYDAGGIYLDIDASFKMPLSQIIKHHKSEIISFESNKISLELSKFKRQLDTRITSYASYLDIQSQLAKRHFPNINNLILQWALFFKPKHPVLGLVIDNIVKTSKVYEGVKISNMHKSICNLTGPVAFTKAVWEYSLYKEVNLQGIDFNGEGIFKNVPKGGTYANDKSHYSKLSGQTLLRKPI